MPRTPKPLRELRGLLARDIPIGSQCQPMVRARKRCLPRCWREVAEMVGEK